MQIDSRTAENDELTKSNFHFLMLRASTRRVSLGLYGDVNCKILRTGTVQLLTRSALRKVNGFVECAQ